MNLKKTALTTITVILSSILFSSCTDDRYYDDYHWENAYVESVVTIRSDSRGYFEGIYDIDTKSDIFDLNNRPIGQYVSDLRYENGDIIINAQEPMSKLTLVLHQRGTARSVIDLLNIRRGENKFSSTGVYNFLFEVSDVLRRDGY